LIKYFLDEIFYSKIFKQNFIAPLPSPRGGDKREAAPRKREGQRKSKGGKKQGGGFLEIWGSKFPPRGIFFSLGKFL